jgi:CspA family cold shock protein
MYQVKWFNKRKGYGFVSGDLFVHHSDISVSGYKYLKRGEYITGEVVETGGKKKLSNIRAPMEGGKLMCEVESEDQHGLVDGLVDGLVRQDRLGSAPDGDGQGGVDDIHQSIPDGGLRATAPEYAPDTITRISHTIRTGKGGKGGKGRGRRPTAE